MKIKIPISYNIVRAFGLTLLVIALIPLFTIEECKNSTYFIIIICSYAVITTPTRLLIFFNVLSVSYKCPKCSNLNPISVNFKESVSNSGVNRTSFFVYRYSCNTCDYRSKRLIMWFVRLNKKVWVKEYSDWQWSRSLSVRSQPAQ